MSLDDLLKSLEKELGVTIKELQCGPKIACSSGGSDNKDSPKCTEASITIVNASLSSVLRIMVKKGATAPLVLDRGLNGKVSIIIGCTMSSETTLQLVPQLLSALELVAVPLPNNRQFITAASSETARASGLPDRDEITVISREGAALRFIAAPLSSKSVSEKSAPPASPPSTDKVLLTKQDCSDALANFRKVVTEYRSVPYFRHGAAVGIRLFAIRSGGIVAKLGLRNGDVIMSVDANSVVDGAAFLGHLQELLRREKGEIALEREGTKHTIVLTVS